MATFCKPPTMQSRIFQGTSQRPGSSLKRLLTTASAPTLCPQTTSPSMAASQPLPHSTELSCWNRYRWITYRSHINLNSGDQLNSVQALFGTGTPAPRSAPMFLWQPVWPLPQATWRYEGQPPPWPLPGPPHPDPVLYDQVMKWHMHCSFIVLPGNSSQFDMTKLSVTNCKEESSHVNDVQEPRAGPVLLPLHLCRPGQDGPQLQHHHPQPGQKMLFI